MLDGGTPQMTSVEADGSASAMWITDATPQEAADSYTAALEAAGYTAETNSTMGDMIVGEYVGNGYTVSFNSIDAEGQTTVMVTASKD